MDMLIKQLQTLPVFAALTSDQLNHLLDHSRNVSLEKGQVLFRMGTLSRHFYFLKTGQMKIARNSKDGLEKVLAIVHPQQVFAEAVMFVEGNLFPATATAIEASEVIGFDNQIFVGYLRESNDLSMAMLGNLTIRLHQQIIEIDNLTMRNAHYRLLHYMETLIPPNATNTAEIELPAPKNTIASRLSIRPETLSRVLHELDTQAHHLASGEKKTDQNL